MYTYIYEVGGRNVFCINEEGGREEGGRDL